MAYKDSFYYDEFDYDNYHESLDYDSEDEHLPSFSDVLFCGFSITKQIFIQLLCLLCVNFVYRLIRQSSKWFMELTFRCSTFALFVHRPSRVHQAFVFFFAWISFNMHLLHDRQHLRSHSHFHFLWFSETAASCETKETRILCSCVSNSADIHMVSQMKDPVIN